MASTSSSKLLYPPFYWAGVKPGLQPDRTKVRWSKVLRREMRHGTYDWDKREDHKR